MLILHNRISKKELKKRILFENEDRVTLSFYKYFFIKNVKKHRDDIYKYFYQYKVLGRIYIAQEGINAQISVLVKYYHLIKNFIYNLDQSLNQLRINKCLENNAVSFFVLSVKIKNKIVEDGITNFNFNPTNVGIYINAQQVNTMIHDENVIFLDMRNSYEYRIGHFENAIEIESTNFRSQLQLVVQKMNYAKKKKIVMYCTGGIRCEKATAWMLFNGFKNIYHIEGGIIGYVHNAKKNNLPILFKGRNFVFDNRMSEKVSNDIISFCEQCNQSSDIYVNCKYHKCHKLFIQCQNCSKKFNTCCSSACMKQKV